MSSWHNYPTVFALGHKALEHLFNGPVVVQEKIDGSQFSFGVHGGELKCRSKGKELVLDVPENMFEAAVATSRRLADAGDLVEGLTYRCEYLKGPSHNSLVYDRIPRNHLVLFDIEQDDSDFVEPEKVAYIADVIGLEPVPTFYVGEVGSPDEVKAWMDRTSVLGGQKIEGVVIKNYAQFAPDKHTLMGKYVSEAFKEVHKEKWGESNPKYGDIIERLAGTYVTKARWNKAVQHLQDAGDLEQSPRDIRKLIVEVTRDVEQECREEIANALYQWAWPRLRRKLTTGLPEWYKETLLEAQFAS